MQAVVCEGKGTDMDGYTLSISRCLMVVTVVLVTKSLVPCKRLMTNR